MRVGGEESESGGRRVRMGGEESEGGRGEE